MDAELADYEDSETCSDKQQDERHDEAGAPGRFAQGIRMLDMVDVEIQIGLFRYRKVQLHGFALNYWLNRRIYNIGVPEASSRYISNFRPAVLYRCGVR